MLLEEFVQTGISCRMPACTGRHSQVSKFFFFCIWTFLPGQVGRDTTQITAWVDGGSRRRCPTHCFRRHSLLRISLHPDFIGNPPKILHFCTSLEVLYVSLFLKRNNIYCQIFCNKCIICAKHCLGRWLIWLYTNFHWCGSTSTTRSTSSGAGQYSKCLHKFLFLVQLQGDGWHPPARFQ